MELGFYNSLYKGYTGEFQLMSALYRNGLDALRPPADMGVDIVSVNLKDQLVNPGIPSETLFFQVKTVVTTIQAPSNEGMRGYTQVSFYLKEEELDMLATTNRRALVCYVYDQRNDALTDAYEAPFFCFWIDGLQLKDIREHGGFQHSSNGKFELVCHLRQPATRSGHWYAVVVDPTGRGIPAGYLGTVDPSDTDADGNQLPDHYSIKGYLDYVRANPSSAGNAPGTDSFGSGVATDAEESFGLFDAFR